MLADSDSDSDSDKFTKQKGIHQMKLKIFYLGLLSVFVMATTQQAEAMNRMQRAPEMEQKLKVHEVVGGGLEVSLGEHPTVPRHNLPHRVEDLNNRLGTKAAHPTGPSAHEKLTDLMALQGDVTNGAVNRGANSGAVGVNAADLAGTAIKNEERILARLKAGLAGMNLNAGEYEWRALVSTKTVGTAAGAPHANDILAATAATNIEDFLSELGW